MCAMLVFYVVGSHALADLPPIRTTLEEAKRLLDDHTWSQIGVYPVIKPCK